MIQPFLAFIYLGHGHTVVVVIVHKIVIVGRRWCLFVIANIDGVHHWIVDADGCVAIGYAHWWRIWCCVIFAPVARRGREAATKLIDKIAIRIEIKLHPPEKAASWKLLARIFCWGKCDCCHVPQPVHDVVQVDEVTLLEGRAREEEELTSRWKCHPDPIVHKLGFLG